MAAAWGAVSPRAFNLGLRARSSSDMKPSSVRTAKRSAGDRAAGGGGSPRACSAAAAVCPLGPMHALRGCHSGSSE